MMARVQLFAVARERAGRSTVEVELPRGATVFDLKRALGEQFPALARVVATARISVDAEYAEDSTPITPGAELGLIPPVSGGSEEA